MTVVGVIAAIVVGLALVTAGGFKLVDGPGWPRRAADMGVPTPVAGVVPFVEIGLGAVLAAQALRPWAAIAVTGLLAVFTVVLVARLADGSRPPCACFGTHSTRPLGPLHVARNLGLIALAIVAAVWA